jgi:peptidoglycan hydrolase-like protein with peptidoglycan-binding domain
MAMLLGLSLVSAPPSSAVSSTTKKSFVTSLVTAAQNAQRQYGVPAAVSIAQAVVNTDYGTSTLATSAKNLFGIRCTAKLSASQFAKLAEAQVGKAYILGAEASISNPNPKAFDCSELVQWLFGRSGNPITDLAASQYNVTKKVSGTPKPGDLVFLRNNPARSNGIGHVAVVTKKKSNGDWEIIEARGHAYGVVKTTLSYWKKRSYYAGLRRYAKLNFVGQSGVKSASAASSLQSGCISVTTSGTTVKYSKFTSRGNSILGHAAIVAAGSEYAAARKVLGSDSAFIDAISKVEHSSNASAYAKALRSVISTYDLTQYDVAPLSIVLLSGNTGTKVKALQYLLSASVGTVKVTGKFDSATVKAVKKLQTAKKLTVDGQAGPNTLTALMATLKLGSSGTRVTALKTLLGLAGYTTESGSSLGATTVTALKAFQTKNSLTASGVANAKTWSKLFMLLDTAPTPTVSGTTTVGKKLTAKAGTWGPGTVELSYQWYRGSTAISSATAASYVLQPADAGQAVRVSTTGTKASYTSISRTSAKTAAVTPATLTAAPTPSISGTVAAGKTLTASAGTWAPAPVTVRYQWYRGTTAIAGATGASYQLQAADYKAKIKVIVTGAKSGYYSAVRTSVQTSAVKQGSLTTASTPVISGTVAQGQTLKVTPGTWAPAPGSLAYQWYRGSSAIAGATATTYKLTAADAGRTIKVRVTNTNAAFKAVTRYSANTIKVPTLAWTAAPGPQISGTAKVGKTLTVKAGTWSPTPSLSYRWYRGSTAIKGATHTTYKLTSSDKGKTITVKVTVTKSGYATVTKQASVKVK